MPQIFKVYISTIFIIFNKKKRVKSECKTAHPEERKKNTHTHPENISVNMRMGGFTGIIYRFWLFILSLFFFLSFASRVQVGTGVICRIGKWCEILRGGHRCALQPSSFVYHRIEIRGTMCKVPECWKRNTSFYIDWFLNDSYLYGRMDRKYIDYDKWGEESMM